MKRVLAFALAAAAMMPAAHAREVGVSVEISQPGVFGRVDIGRFPRPAVIVLQPVIVEAPVVIVQPQPIYMWVPPGSEELAQALPPVRCVWRAGVLRTARPA